MQADLPRGGRKQLHSGIEFMPSSTVSIGHQAPATGIRKRLVLTMSVAAGLTIANNYYAQPLLAAIASHMGVGSGAAGLLITANQIGYAAGLVAIVPLGDLLERRRLVMSMIVLSILALITGAVSPSLSILIGASLFIGLASVVPQILVPFAASLASDHERGRVVGTLMSGLLIGILLARTVAGYVGDAFGWRAIYMLAAVLMAVLAGVLWRELPDYRERHVSSYSQLLRSAWGLLIEERILRYRSVYGACVFGAFSVFWTTAAFLLSSPPYRYSSRIIGLFGLLGIAGVIAATAAGRLADRGWARPQTVAFLLCTLFSWLPIGHGAYHIASLILGIVLLDLGVHGTQITNQSEIYRLNPNARSRLTTVYMTTYFAGGAAGSLAGALVYAALGWIGVCWTGAAFVSIALGALALERRPRR
jgi:predicted MFS family arabinose efflux permease